MSETYAIELKNITKRFGKVTANDKVCLSVKKGEILSILGENGSGKTTLMNMISGIYYPDEGQILVMERGDHPFSKRLLCLRHRYDPPAF